MPNDYTCKSCKLQFTVGWFHYHRFDSDFAAQTNLVCGACGTCHTVKHAIAEDKHDELLAQSGPLIGKSLHFKNWLPYDTAVNLRPEREKVKYITLIGSSDTLNLAAIRCAFCHQVGTLIKEWPADNAVYPNCQQSTLECSGSRMT